MSTIDWKNTHADKAGEAVAHPLVESVMAELRDNLGVSDSGLPAYGISKVALYAAQVARAQALGFDPELLRLTPAEATSAQMKLAAEATLRGVPVYLLDRAGQALPDVRRECGCDAGFVTTFLAATVALVSITAACAVSFAAGTNVVEQIPGPTKTVTVQTPGPVKTVEVTRAPERVSRGEERHVTPRATAPGASGLGRPGGHESTPNTGRPTGLWLALAQCESGADLQRVSKSGKYAGAYQFSTQTWAGFTHGRYGPVLETSWPVQTYVAYRIWIKQGWGAFPGCGTKLGHPVMPKVGKP